MSIKSTVTLRRRDALALRDELLGYKPISNRELGDLLDDLKEWRDIADGNACFTNYLVVDDDASVE
jgi:hypothetical protein